MRFSRVCGWAPVLAGVLGLSAGRGQGAKPAGSSENQPKARIAVDARLVVVPAVVFNKKGLVTTLQQGDFALSLDGKPQTVRYFDRDADVPLTVGLLVDTSRSQTEVLDAEQKASQAFLDNFLRKAEGNRVADRAFVMQFAHSAELLQDVTESHALLQAGLKEIGTQAPGSNDEDHPAETSSTDSTTNGGSGNNGSNGGYPRRGGYPGGGRRDGSANDSGTHGDRASGGTVLYDAVYLAADDLMSRQKGRRAMVILTDGVDRHSKEFLKDAIEAAQRSDTVVYAIYYKGHQAPRQWNGNPGYGGYGGYDPYGRYPPTTGGSNDPGTYRDPDGRKILEQICSETGGRVFELKGKGGVEGIYRQIGEELRAQYRLGFTPSADAAGSGFHAIELTLTNPAERKDEIQTRNGVYLGTTTPQ